jgi:hypothetical protein
MRISPDTILNSHFRVVRMLSDEQTDDGLHVWLIQLIRT